jgi:hypothetical protein
MKGGLQMSHAGHAVLSVFPLRNFHLLLEFENGDYRVIDMRPMLWGEVFEPLKDQDFFKKVKVDPEIKTVVWPNDVDLCPDTLYSESKPVEFPSSLGV